MTRPTSRAYKLKLSEKGIGLFLDSHCRFCHIAGDLLSYGATLHAAMALLESRRDEELIAEILQIDLPSYGGMQTRYVGTTHDLARIVERVTDRVIDMGLVHPTPQAWKLFIAGLCSMRSAEDRTIRRAYDHLMRARSGEPVSHGR